MKRGREIGTVEPSSGTQFWPAEEEAADWFTFTRHLELPPQTSGTSGTRAVVTTAPRTGCSRLRSLQISQVYQTAIMPLEKDYVIY